MHYGVVVCVSAMRIFHILNLQGGKSARLVNCVLALKSYSEWKEGGGSGPWKFGGNMKAAGSGKPFQRKNPEPFMNSFLKTLSGGQQTSNGDIGHDLNEVSELCCFLILYILFCHRR